MERTEGSDRLGESGPIRGPADRQRADRPVTETVYCRSGLVGPMTAEYVRNHEHELEAEYLSARDATVVDVHAEGESLFVDVVVPCPQCSVPLRVSAHVREVSEADLELPLDDAEDVYD